MKAQVDTLFLMTVHLKRKKKNCFSLNHFWEGSLCCVTCQRCSSNTGKTAPFLWRSYTVVVVLLDSLGCICCTWQELGCPAGGGVSLPPSEAATTTTESAFNGRNLPAALKKKKQKKEHPLLYMEVCVFACVQVCVCKCVLLCFLLGFCSSFDDLLGSCGFGVVNFGCTLACCASVSTFVVVGFRNSEMSGSVGTMQNANYYYASYIWICRQRFISAVNPVKKVGVRKINQQPLLWK